MSRCQFIGLFREYNPSNFPLHGHVSSNSTFTCRVEDIPLSVLAGHRGVTNVPDFSRMRPHSPPPPAESDGWAEGDRLELHPETAMEHVKPRAAGMMPMEKQLDRPDPAPATTATTWVDFYNPNVDAVREAAALQPEFQRQVGDSR